MTPDEFRAELVRQATELRAVNDRLDRMNRVADARTAAALAAGVPSPAAPAPPPPPPDGPPPGLPTFGPRLTPATQLGNGVPVPGQAVAQAAARQAELRARRAAFERAEAERAWRNSQPPRAPAVRTGRR